LEHALAAPGRARKVRRSVAAVALGSCAALLATLALEGSQSPAVRARAAALLGPAAAKIGLHRPAPAPAPVVTADPAVATLYEAPKTDGERVAPPSPNAADDSDAQ